MLIKLANNSPWPFHGWKRTNIDFEPPFAAGIAEGTQFVVADATGRDTTAIDVLVDLLPGERKTIDLEGATATDFELGHIGAKDWAGGPMTINGQPMEFASVNADGAAWSIRMHARVGKMMHADVWLRHYPGQPYAEAELLWIASNPDVPDLHEDAPEARISLGDGIVMACGRQFYEPLVDATRFGDGQARAVPFTVLWPRHLSDNPAGLQSWQAVHSQLLGAIGISKLHPDGNPALPANTNALGWARQYMPAAMAALHDWGPPVASIAADSGQTGSQYDQLFRHGEPMFEPGAEAVTYLAALKYSNRPCHHLESDGTMLSQDAHPDCRFWSSRNHWHGGVSPDRLGKDGVLSETSGNFWGADRQHWLIGTLCAGYRYTGSPALQALLEHQANAFLFGETVESNVSTSNVDSGREIGYAGLAAVQLWNNLADRRLAAKVRERWVRRVTDVYIPQYGNMPGDIWDPRNDARILWDLDKGREPKRYTQGVMHWQQSLGSWGLDYACELLGPVEGREMALRAAKAVLRHAWRKEGNTWKFWENTGYVEGGEVMEPSEYEESKGAHSTGWFTHSWAVPGIACILRHEPEHEEAREIWNQVTANGGSWVPPGEH